MIQANSNVIHMNVVDFMCSVEEIIHPSLKGSPFVIAMDPKQGIIIDHSHEAYKYGIHKQMSVSQARKIEPKIKVLQPNFEYYERAKLAIIKEIRQVSQHFTDQGDGNFFFTFSAERKRPEDMALSFERHIKERYRLKSSVGIGNNLLVSKVASRLVKPYGLCQVPIGQEADLIASLPVQILPVVHPSLELAMRKLGIQTIEDLLKLDYTQLMAAFPKFAAKIYDQARGIDFGLFSASYKDEIEFRRKIILQPTNDIFQIRVILLNLLNELLMTLKRKLLFTGKIFIEIEYYDLKKSSGMVMFGHTDSIKILEEPVSELFNRIYKRRTRLITLLLQLARLKRNGIQLNLF